MNKNYLRRDGLLGLLGLTAMALLLNGCGDKAEGNPEPLPNYYPLSVGSYRIYDVADTVWRNNVPTASRFQFREQVVGEPTPDAAGEPVYQVVRSRRNSAADAWQADSVLTVKVAPLYVTEQLNNRRTVELVLPAVEGKSWSYHAFNRNYNYDDKQDSVSAVTRFYQHVNQPLSISRGGQTYQYPNTVTTINDTNFNSKNNNAVRLIIQRTTYAVGVGPVNRVSRSYKNDCTGAEGCRLPFVRYLGQSRNQVLIESGK